MESSLHRLPVEIFQIIAVELDLPSYQSLRLSSRQLYCLSLSAFTKCYFTHLSSSLGSASLDRLVNISKHGYFSQAVVLLDIKLLNHRDYKLLTTVHRINKYPPPKRFPKIPAIRPAHISSESTLYSDVLSSNYPACIVDPLVRALQGFGKLTTIRFRTLHTEPIGWRTTNMPEGDQTFRNKCFQAVFDAIMKSKIQLRDFSMSRGSPFTAALRKCPHLTYPTLQLPFTCHPAIRYCFANLQSLTLSVVSSFHGDARVPGWENGLSHLIACAPNLKHLALSLDRTDLVSHYSAAIIHSLALSCRIEALETLHLANCSLQEPDLSTLIIEHAGTIQQFFLANARLLTGGWSSSFMSLMQCKNLQCLRLASLKGVNSPIIFKKRGKDKPKIVLDVEKSGRDMHTLLCELITACHKEIDISTQVDMLE